MAIEALTDELTLLHAERTSLLSQLSSLDDRITALETQHSQLQNLALPLFRLPEEILVTIFRLLHWHSYNHAPTRSSDSASSPASQNGANQSGGRGRRGVVAAGRGAGASSGSAVDAAAAHDEKNAHLHLHNLPFELAASQVCHEWRAIALRTPLLWNRIRVYDEPWRYFAHRAASPEYHEHKLARLAAYLVRSAACPLIFAVHAASLWSLHHTLERVLPHVRRWQNVVMYVLRRPGAREPEGGRVLSKAPLIQPRFAALYAPLLQSFACHVTGEYQADELVDIALLSASATIPVCIPPIFQGGTPQLTSLHLGWLAFHLFVPALPPTLTSLHLEGSDDSNNLAGNHLSYTFLAALLTPIRGTLRTLTLNNVSVTTSVVPLSSPENLTGPTPIVLERLRHLRMRGSTSCTLANRLLEVVRFPRVRSLHLIDYYELGSFPNLIPPAVGPFAYTFPSDNTSVPHSSFFSSSSPSSSSSTPSASGQRQRQRQRQRHIPAHFPAVRTLVLLNCAPSALSDWNNLLYYVPNVRRLVLDSCAIPLLRATEMLDLGQTILSLHAGHTQTQTHDRDHNHNHNSNFNSNHSHSRSHSYNGNGDDDDDVRAHIPLRHLRELSVVNLTPRDVGPLREFLQARRLICEMLERCRDEYGGSQGGGGGGGGVGGGVGFGFGFGVGAPHPHPHPPPPSIIMQPISVIRLARRCRDIIRREVRHLDSTISASTSTSTSTFASNTSNNTSTEVLQSRGGVLKFGSPEWLLYGLALGAGGRLERWEDYVEEIRVGKARREWFGEEYEQVGGGTYAQEDGEEEVEEEEGGINGNWGEEEGDRIKEKRVEEELVLDDVFELWGFG